MGEYQKKLIELLDKEGLMDEELKFGCLVLDKFHRDNDNNGEILKILEKTKEMDGIHITHYITNYTTYHNLISTQEIFNEREHYKRNGKNEGELRYKLIGQYHLGNILQWFERQQGDTRFRMYEEGLSNRKGDIILNYTKPPMEWSEEQNKELVEFMEKVLDSNK